MKKEKNIGYPCSNCPIQYCLLTKNVKEYKEISLDCPLLKNRVITDCECKKD